MCCVVWFNCPTKWHDCFGEMCSLKMLLLGHPISKQGRLDIVLISTKDHLPAHGVYPTLNLGVYKCGIPKFMVVSMGKWMIASQDLQTLFRAF